MTVAATSKDNAWAVGLGGSHMVIEHWNGKSWGIVHSPVADGTLLGVTATSASDAWAVGSSSTGILILHWNGKSWKRSAAPSPKNGAINAVTATSARNAWAVGEIFPPNKSVSKVLIEHWNGKSWRIDPASQPPSCGCYLFGVAASSAGNAWAVGDNTNNNLFSGMVIERWTGKRWGPVRSSVLQQGGLLTG